MPSNILSDQLLDVRVRLRFEFYPPFFDPLLGIGPQSQDQGMLLVTARPWLQRDRHVAGRQSRCTSYRLPAQRGWAHCVETEYPAAANVQPLLCQPPLQCMHQIFVGLRW